MADARIFCDTVLLPGGWESGQLITVAKGRIETIEPGAPGEADLLLRGPVIPGMANAHSHGFQRMIAGRTGVPKGDADNFWTWREAMYGLANRLTAEQFGDCLAWVYAEMLKAGYTSCAEFHYLHHRPDGTPYPARAEMSLRVLDAADAAGMAILLLPVLYCSAGFDHPLQDQQRRFHNTLDEYLRLVEDCRQAAGESGLHGVGVAPHSLRAVPADVLVELSAGSGGERSSPVHIHVAEQPREVEECLAHLGARPVEWLLDHLPVDDRWCLVHATHLATGELRRAAASGAVVGLCPSTEADLGDGYFRLAEWIDAGGRFAIGSDSNLRVSPSEELRMLEFHERLKTGRRNVLTDGNLGCGRFLYQHAAEAGAVALGQDTGSLKAGCRADLVELDGAHPVLAGGTGDEILDSFVFAGGNDMVRSVFVAGRQLVAEGRHVHEGELRGRYLRASAAQAGP